MADGSHGRGSIARLRDDDDKHNSDSISSSRTSAVRGRHGRYREDAVDLIHVASLTLNQTWVFLENSIQEEGYVSSICGALELHNRAVAIRGRCVVYKVGNKVRRSLDPVR